MVGERNMENPTDQNLGRRKFNNYLIRGGILLYCGGLADILVALDQNSDAAYKAFPSPLSAREFDELEKKKAINDEAILIAARGHNYSQISTIVSSEERESIIAKLDQQKENSEKRNELTSKLNAESFNPLLKKLNRIKLEILAVGLGFTMSFGAIFFDKEDRIN